MDTISLDHGHAMLSRVIQSPDFVVSDRHCDSLSRCTGYYYAKIGLQEQTSPGDDQIIIDSYYMSRRVGGR